jgi:hypothetical protein
MSVPDRSAFESLYAGQPPWEIGRPQKPFLDVADQITGSILDAGCGTGENALYFASRDQTFNRPRHTPLQSISTG